MTLLAAAFALQALVHVALWELVKVINDLVCGLRPSFVVYHINNLNADKPANNDVHQLNMPKQGKQAKSVLLQASAVHGLQATLAFLHGVTAHYGQRKHACLDSGRLAGRLCTTDLISQTAHVHSMAQHTNRQPLLQWSICSISSLANHAASVYSLFQHGMAWHGSARHGTAWHCTTWHGVPRHDMAQHDVAQHA